MTPTLATALEASTRWCPFTRVRHLAPGISPYSYNRENASNNSVPEGSTCMAGACMAWRWVQSDVEEMAEFQTTGTAQARAKIAPPAGEGWVEVSRGSGAPPGWPEPPNWTRWVQWRRPVPAVPGRGYCGLAPQPVEDEPLIVTGDAPALNFR